MIPPGRCAEAGCRAEPYRERVATTEVQNAWASRDSRRLQIVPGSALAGNSNCKNRVTELRFLVIVGNKCIFLYIYITHTDICM